MRSMVGYRRVRTRHLRGGHDIWGFWFDALVSDPIYRHDRVQYLDCLPADEYVPEALDVLYGLGCAV